MAYFLVKASPVKTTHSVKYSIDDLERNKTVDWDAVYNPQAQRAIQSMRTGDDVLFYHCNISDPAVVGLARVTTEPYLNPNVRESKNWVFDMAFVRRFAQPVTLREIRESHLFDNWTLLRQKQVSVMDVPDSFIEWLKARRTL